MNAASEDFLRNLYGAGFTFCRTDLEDCFRALVGWPGEAPIPNTNADQRQDLLAGVCRALIALEDERIMPFGTFAIVLDAAGAERLNGGSYAHGARAALNTLSIFDKLQREASR